MKLLATLVFWYCLCAVLVLTVVVAFAATTLCDVRQRTASEESKLERLATDVAEKRAGYLDLKERQRSERAGYDAPEAVASSYAVQQANQSYIAAQQRLDHLERLMSELREEQHERSIGLIPYMLAVLIHALAATAIWPYRRRAGKGAT